jgi:hypothetical protein
MKPTLYPLTREDGEKYKDKEIAFRNLWYSYRGGFLSGNKGRLDISTNGIEGWAAMHADDNHGHTAIINLSEEQFRSITPVGSGFLLDWSGWR